MALDMGKIPFFHTIRKPQIVSKNSIFRKYEKIGILNFRAKNQIIIVNMILSFISQFEFSRQKLSKFNSVLFEVFLQIFSFSVQLWILMACWPFWDF